MCECGDVFIVPRRAREQIGGYFEVHVIVWTSKRTRVHIWPPEILFTSRVLNELPISALNASEFNQAFP